MATQKKSSAKGQSGTQVKVSDLKPSKDAKGGRVTNAKNRLAKIQRN